MKLSLTRTYKSSQVLCFPTFLVFFEAYAPDWPIMGSCPVDMDEEG